MAAKASSPRFSKLCEIDNARHIPAPYRLKRFYTPNEISKHNSADDCWVSFFGKVYDLTVLIQTNYSKLCDPIIKVAGADITHWFEASTHEPKTYIHPETNLQTTYCPNGRYLHIPLLEPDSEWIGDIETPWW
jgi:cytochrome b involved in lipid metabolism